MTDKKKWIAIIIEIAFILVFVFLCFSLSNRNRHIKFYKEKIAIQERTIDSLQNRCDKLGAVDCITVTTNCTITNKGLVNVSQTNQISKTVSTYTREQVVDILDSLNKVNNADN